MKFAAILLATALAVNVIQASNPDAKDIIKLFSNVYDFINAANPAERSTTSNSSASTQTTADDNSSQGLDAKTNSDVDPKASSQRSQILESTQSNSPSTVDNGQSFFDLKNDHDLEERRPVLEPHFFNAPASFNESVSEQPNVIEPVVPLLDSDMHPLPVNNTNPILDDTTIIEGMSDKPSKDNIPSNDKAAVSENESEISLDLASLFSEEEHTEEQLDASAGPAFCQEPVPQEFDSSSRLSESEFDLSQSVRYEYDDNVTLEDPAAKLHSDSNDLEFFNQLENSESLTNDGTLSDKEIVAEDFDELQESSRADSIPKVAVSDKNGAAIYSDELPESSEPGSLLTAAGVGEIAAVDQLVAVERTVESFDSQLSQLKHSDGKGSLSADILHSVNYANKEFDQPSDGRDSPSGQPDPSPTSKPSFQDGFEGSYQFGDDFDAAFDHPDLSRNHPQPSVQKADGLPEENANNSKNSYIGYDASGRNSQMMAGAVDELGTTTSESTQNISGRNPQMMAVADSELGITTSESTKDISGFSLIRLLSAWKLSIIITVSIAFALILIVLSIRYRQRQKRLAVNEMFASMQIPSSHDVGYDTIHVVSPGARRSFDVKYIR